MHPAYHGAQTGIPLRCTCDLLTPISQVLTSAIIPSKVTSWRFVSMPSVREATHVCILEASRPMTLFCIPQ